MDKKTLVVAGCSVILGTATLIPPSADAQRGHAEVRESRQVGEYAGVRAPGGRPPRQRAINRARQNRRRSTLLTWPGFRPSEAQGGGAFFLQLSSAVQSTTNASPGRFEVILPNVSTHVRNTRRPLETRYFNTPVTRVKVERRGRRNLAVVFELRQDVTPTVRLAPSNEEGFHYLWVEFPAGSYLPQDLRREAPPEPVEPSDDEVLPSPYDAPRGLTPTQIEEMENERPPR